MSQIASLVLRVNKRDIKDIRKLIREQYCVHDVARFVETCVAWISACAPLSYWSMPKWLSGFTYHVAFTWRMFICVAAAGVLIAFFKVSCHSILAVSVSPVNSLSEY